jgi:hypothetical protein
VSSLPQHLTPSPQDRRDTQIRVFTWVKMLQDIDHVILSLLCEGKTHADIAAKIGCNKKTVQRKVAKWCSVLALPDRAGLTTAYFVHFPEQSRTAIPTALRTSLMRNDIASILKDADRLSRVAQHNTQLSENTFRNHATGARNKPMYAMDDLENQSLAKDDSKTASYVTLTNPLLWRDIVENARELRFNTNILNGRMPDYRLIDSLLFEGNKNPILETDALASRIESDSKIWLIASLAARALDLPMPGMTDVEREYCADNGHAQRLRWQRELQFTLDLGEGAYARFAGISFWVLMYPQLLSCSRRVPNEHLMKGAITNPLCPIVGMLVRLMATSHRFYDGESKFAGNAEPWRDWLKMLIAARTAYLGRYDIDAHAIIASVNRA